MFTVPYLQLEVDQWDIKKKKLLEVMNSHDMCLDSSVLTSFYDSTNGKTEHQNKIIESIFEDELNHMKKSFGFKFYSIQQFWFQEQYKNMYHPIHDHSDRNIGLSSICYIDFDPLEHTAVNFISPFIDSFRLAHTNYSPQVNSGSMLFFPSNILHQTLPNSSDKVRRIISINLDVR
jgi:hypothetical protein